MRLALLVALPGLLFAQSDAPAPAQDPQAAQKSAPLQVEPLDLREKFRFVGLRVTDGAIKAAFTCIAQHRAAQAGSELCVPLDGDKLELAKATWGHGDGSKDGSVSTGTPQPSWSEALGTNAIGLDRNMLLESFRINVFRPVGETDSTEATKDTSWFRVSLLCIAPIKREGQADPIIQEGTRIFCLAEIRQGKVLLRFSREKWSGAHTVMGPGGLELQRPIFILPSCEGLDLRDLDTLSLDDTRTMAWWMRGQDTSFYRKPKKTSLGLYSNPLDIQLYAGATWSNIYSTPTQGGSSNFFSERGLLRLEAAQAWSDEAALGFLQSVIVAQVEPDKAVEVKDLSGLVTAIRTSKGFLGAVDLSLGYTLFQHTNVGVGVRLSAQQERMVPLAGTGNPNPSVPPVDQVVNQRHYFLRLQQQDPLWRGSFFELGLKTHDERFRDPEVPNNENRRLFRGRVAFRPERWSVTSFVLEASMNRATNSRSKLPEESRILVGFRVDLKNFSLPTWHF